MGMAGVSGGGVSARGQAGRRAGCEPWGASQLDARRGLRRANQGATPGQRSPTGAPHPGPARQVDAGGTVSLRYRSRLRHIALGRANKGRRVVLLIADRDVRVLSAEGEVLRYLTLDPRRAYQPLG